MAIKGILSDSLCWKCSRSTDSSCSWSKDFIPVKGWDAEPTERYSEVYRNSFNVRACPMFAQYETRPLNDIGTEKLCNAVMARAGTDYMRILQSIQRETDEEHLSDLKRSAYAMERFFKSEYAEMFGLNPIYVMEAVKRKVKNDK